jgi:hypothetical protein
MDTEAQIRRRTNVSSRSLAAAVSGELPLPGSDSSGLGAGYFGSLFSDIYGTEKNCTSGIAMFIVRTTGNLIGARGPEICHY